MAKPRARPASRLVIVLLALAAFTATPSPASAETEPDFQEWVQVFVDAKADRVLPGLRLSLDLHLRRMNAPLAGVAGMPGVFDQNPNTLFILRPSVGYAFNDWGTVTLGYAWVPNFFDDPDVRAARNVSEHRIWEQLGGRWVVGPAELGFRSRMEHRVRNNGPGSSENDAGLPRWAHRFRQQVRVAITLRANQPWQIVASDEIFLHLNETNYRTEPGFDQNRAFVGIGYNLPAMRAELGYMNQYVHRYTDPHQVNHGLALNVILKLGGAAPAPVPVPVRAEAEEPESTAGTSPTGESGIPLSP